MRRALLGLFGSVAIHGALMALVVGYAAWRSWSNLSGVEITPISLEAIKELPLGPPPASSQGGVSAAKPARRMRARTNASAGTVALPLGDAGAEAAPVVARPDGGADQEGTGADGGAAPRLRDLRSYGPEGSRLTALLRLDRVRDLPEAHGYTAAIDAILWHLPDRRRLIEGTGLDLYRDFEAILVATPNPFDDAVTFLAARHRRSDEELRGALDRGAEASGRAIRWRMQRGRPVGVRKRRAMPPGVAEPLDRDDRLFVLPRAGLAVMTPPAYAKLLLSGSEHSGAPDGGATDGGATQALPATEPRADWRELIARIDAEDSAMPDEAVLMVTATNLLQIAGGDERLVVVPGTRGASDDDIPAVVPPKLPKVATLVLSATPTLTVDVTADFDTEAHARAWQQEWPVWRRKALSNPFLMLAGLGPIVSRTELERDGAVITIRTHATAEETPRVLQLITQLANAAHRR